MCECCGKHAHVTISCPDCEADIPVAADVHADDIISCPACGAELLITAVEPQLAYKLIEEEK
ncbi:MAG TPA: lysine biosynthesis protein LysW [bacterium]|nr:lysine biosynthesis protein LysW [bacterium]